MSHGAALPLDPDRKPELGSFSLDGNWLFDLFQPLEVAAHSVLRHAAGMFQIPALSH